MSIKLGIECAQGPYLSLSPSRCSLSLSLSLFPFSFFVRSFLRTMGTVFFMNKIIAMLNGNTLKLNQCISWIQAAMFKMKLNLLLRVFSVEKGQLILYWTECKRKKSEISCNETIITVTGLPIKFWLVPGNLWRSINEPISMRLTQTNNNNRTFQTIHNNCQHLSWCSLNRLMHAMNY